MDDVPSGGCAVAAVFLRSNRFTSRPSAAGSPPR
jgi:hypothetical protein